MTAVWGWSMAGCEETIQEAVRLAIAIAPGPVRYLEIGVALANTFARVCEILAAGGKPWEAVAVDLPDGIDVAEHYSRGNAVCVNVQSFAANTAPFRDHVRLVRAVSQRWLVDPENGERFDVTLIDGCHERDCTREDFEALERHVPIGGVVILHDTADWSQHDPLQIQAHRGQPLEVRAALEDLALLPCTRPGWRFLREAPGQQALQGRGCMAFQRSA